MSVICLASLRSWGLLIWLLTIVFCGWSFSHCLGSKYGDQSASYFLLVGAEGRAAAIRRSGPMGWALILPGSSLPTAMMRVQLSGIFGLPAADFSSSALSLPSESSPARWAL